MTMYANQNFRTKKALKEAVAQGKQVSLFQAGIGPRPVLNGTETISGPHFPEPHTWYARVQLKDGIVVKVIQ